MNAAGSFSLRHGLRVSLVVGSIFLGGLGLAADEPGRLTLRDGKLTAHVSAAPVRQVMQEVSSLTGARVLWLGHAEDRKVSVDFTDLPLADALRRILGESNFMLFYTSRGKETWLSEIWVSAPSAGRGQPVAAAPAPPPTQAPAQLMQTALYGQDLSSRLNAIKRIKKFAQADPRVRSILSQLSRSAAEPEVREAAENALAEIAETSRPGAEQPRSEQP